MSDTFDIIIALMMIPIIIRGFRQMPVWWRDPSQTKSYKILSLLFILGSVTASTGFLIWGIFLAVGRNSVGWQSLILWALSLYVFVGGIVHVKRWGRTDHEHLRKHY